ncbi:response regulator [Noviherbaspirillum denitrificans]|uniref:response regulator n=1 Tax=Noviherbaspirillum denitrificans TaxID=1968433 RepID=UPI0014831E00|nr:response regulator [Noviherbaspirillum denitrificans]
MRNELNILIADDDRTTRHVLRLLLREHGHQVVAEASDGEKAVELCDAHKPDIAFLDIDMPRLDGHLAAERIRLNTPGVRMIMVTNLPTLDNVQKALQVGISGFVVKPFNAVKVVEAIDHCMKQKR